MFLEQSLVDMHESEKMIAMKVERLQAHIKWKAGISAVGGAVPFPWISAAVLQPVDTLLVLEELEFQRKQLQIDEATMQKHTETFGPEFKIQLEANISADVQQYLVGFDPKTMVRLAASITSCMLASEAVEWGAKLIPILGSIAGAGISAAVTYNQLTTALDAHKEIALNTTKVVTEIRVRARSGIN